MLRRLFLTGLLIFGSLALAFAQGDDGTRLKFPRGATSTTVKGTVAKGGPDFYLVGARSGQTMTVKVTGKVSFGLDSPAGRLTEDDSNTSWSEELPEDGDYKIRVYSAGGAQNYSLTVAISATPKTAAKFTTSGYFDGIEMTSKESGDYGGTSVYLTESDGQLYALVMTAAGDYFTPVLVEAKASGKDLRTIEFTLPEPNNYDGKSKYKGTVSAAGLTLVDEDSKDLLKRECGYLVSNIAVGSGGDYGGMEVFLTDAGGTWYALVTVADGVLMRPVLTEVKTRLKNSALDTIEFTLPNENGGRKFTGKVTRTGLMLNEGGTQLVLKDKCYK
jgi:hypothetical protein